MLKGRMVPALFLESLGTYVQSLDIIKFSHLFPSIIKYISDGWAQFFNPYPHFFFIFPKLLLLLLLFSIPSPVLSPYVLKYVYVRPIDSL